MTQAANDGFFFTAWADVPTDGGRDGLGLLPVWSRVARRGILNVTTVSSDLAGWRTLIGCVGIVSEWLGTSQSDDEWTERLLAAERLVAYARVQYDRTSPGPRGETLAKQLVMLPAIWVFGLDRPSILDSQLRTGVFGQIGRPAITSGLLKEGYGLTNAGQAIWAEQNRALALSDSQRTLLKRILIGAEPLKPKGHDHLLTTLATCFGNTAMASEQRVLWREHLLVPSTVEDETDWKRDVQQQLVEQFQKHDTPVTTPEALRDLRSSLLNNSKAAVWLDYVLHTERVLGPIEWLFRALLVCLKEGKKTREETEKFITKEIETRQESPPGGSLQEPPLDWTALNKAAAEAYGSGGEAFIWILRKFHTAWTNGRHGNSKHLLSSILELNSWVVNRRKKRRWIATDDNNDTLQAEVTRGASDGPKGKLEHGYYLDELRRLTMACTATETKS